MKKIKVGARSSPLSQAQVKEVTQEFPDLFFINEWVETTGDLDQETSLRGLDKTDFFTKELDRMLLNNEIQAAIHSAKDLPDPLPDGLAIAALTAGTDPSDSLVLRPKETLESLGPHAKIATSSARREEAVKKLLGKNCHFVDIRGTIGKRLAKLQTGQVDGVVIAEAALLRLCQGHLNRYRLPGNTAPYQGKLAILCREQDMETKELFASIDTRTKVLWTGLKAPRGTLERRFDHFPLIECVATKDAIPNFSHATHLLFTSQTAVKIFAEQELKCPKNAPAIAIGKATAEAMTKQGISPKWIAENESSEGVIALLKKLDLQGATVFWPHSKKSRTVIAKNIPCQLIEWECYDTFSKMPARKPDLFDKVVFTSPSAVDSWLAFFQTLPPADTIETIGPVTKDRLLNISHAK